MKAAPPSLFDAVRVVRFPHGGSEAPVYFSQTGRSQLKLGDIGVVIGDWSGGKLRVEAVLPSGAIDWQDHLTLDQVEVVALTEAAYPRRRINEAWAWNLASNGKKQSSRERDEALRLARKVMAFARRNVETLVDRLTQSGYCFAAKRPFVPPRSEIASQLKELAASKVHVPIALQAWLLEVGGVDLRGSHPQWPRSAYSGICDESSPDAEPLYTDPLFLDADLASLSEQMADDPRSIERIDIAPDDVTKANVSGGGPIAIACDRPAFDNVLIGQHGSFTILSYLNHAFRWGGFPGFEFIADPPTEMLDAWRKDLIRL